MSHARSRRSPPEKSGRTTVSIAGRQAPPLPHEADESTADRGQQSDARVEQAHADVKRGLVDTDKGPVMQGTYERLRNSKPAK